MMKKGLLDNEQKPSNYFGNLLADYINLTIKSLIMFGVAFILYFIFKRWLSSIVLFIASFLISLFLTLILSKPLNKINFIGNKIQERYLKFLNKIK